MAKKPREQMMLTRCPRIEAVTYQRHYKTYIYHEVNTSFSNFTVNSKLSDQIADKKTFVNSIMVIVEEPKFKT